jgi:flagellar motor switch protein FliG
MTPSVLGVGNVRRAAIILGALGEELASEVCSLLPAAHVMALGEELYRLQQIPTVELNRVLAEFTGRLRTSASFGGPAYARSLLENALGGSQSALLQGFDPSTVTSLARLDELEPAALWRVLRDEKPQMIAMMLTYLSPGRASELLSQLDQKAAADIAYRAARLASPAPGVVQALSEALAVELRSVQTQTTGSVELSEQFVIDLIGNMPPARSKEVVAALQEVDQAFADVVSERIFTFEDIVALADADLQLLLRSIDMNQLFMALKGTSPELRERVKQNLSQRVQERLDEEISMLGAVPLSQVQEAQREICRQARAMADEGQIRLDGGSMEYVE